MPKIVILGSCRYEPYDVLAVPDRIKGGTNDDAGYQKASKIFPPAIDKADVVFVFAPDGIGEHTQRDIDYARSVGKTVFILKELCDGPGSVFQNWPKETEPKALAHHCAQCGTADGVKLRNRRSGLIYLCDECDKARDGSEVEH